MIFLFYIFAGLQVYFSYKSFRGGVAYLDHFRKNIAEPAFEFRPFVTVIAPCKGVDQGFEKNVAALFGQEYPGYEIIFVVDDEQDPALGILRDISRKDAKAAKKIVVAQKAEGSGQKIANLREAMLHAAGESEAFVFVDSDARPSRDWLRHLVAPLADESVGAATGYRWFISERPDFASEMRSVWNASVASALGPNTGSNFCWGGSTAIRREVFEKLQVRDKWIGKLSDDFALTRILKEADLPIVFAPRALTASVENCTFRELIEFTTRQMKITRVYSPHLWAASFIGSAIFCSVMTAAFMIVLLSRENNAAVWVSLAVILLVSAFSIAKADLRLRAVMLAMPQYAPELRRQRFTQCTLWLISPLLFLYNCAAALFSRRLRWRGIDYILVSNAETHVENRRPNGSPPPAPKT